ncbi:unnamed protein product [Closterium sp. Yama58-4]|nr:unnamed protein product [Closterium sp. Yama58-4]
MSLSDSTSEAVRIPPSPPPIPSFSTLPACSASPPPPQSPLSVPMEVSVVLVGLDGDGAYRVDVEGEHVEYLLHHGFSYHRPACWETKREMLVQHELSYNVVKASEESLVSLEKAVRSNLKLAPGSAAAGSNTTLYTVEATSIEPTFDRMYSDLFEQPAEGEGEEGGSAGENQPHKAIAVFLCNLDKTRMDPSRPPPSGPATSALTEQQVQEQEGGYTYAYSYHGAGHAQTWLSHARYVVIDLSAGPVMFGHLGEAEGAVVPGTVPRVRSMFLPDQPTLSSSSSTAAAAAAAAAAGNAGGAAAAAVAAAAAASLHGAGKPQSKEFFSGALADVVSSAVEHLFSPDVRFLNVDVSHRVLVAVIVLSNHRHFNPLAPGHAHSINLHQLEAQITGMLAPGQEVVLVNGWHSLHDHERLAMAVEKSIRHHSVLLTHADGSTSHGTTSFLDAPYLLHQFHESADMLASALLEAAHPALSASLFLEDPAAAVEAADEAASASEEDSVVRTSPPSPSKAPPRRTILPVKRSWDAHVGLKDRTKSTARRAVDAELAREHGTRVLPVFVLSLAGIEGQLTMADEGGQGAGQQVYAAPDAVLVLQTAENTTVRTRFVSEGQPVFVSPQHLQRPLTAGIAASLGGLKTLSRRLCVYACTCVLVHASAFGAHSPACIPTHTHAHMQHQVHRQRSMRRSWVWAVGHHPFGPVSNTSSLSLLLRDSILMNAVYSRVDISLRSLHRCIQVIGLGGHHLLSLLLKDSILMNAVYSRVDISLRSLHRCIQAIEDFSNTYLFAALGNEVYHPTHSDTHGSSNSTGSSLKAVLKALESIYSDPARSSLPIPHSVVERLTHSLKEAEEHLSKLSSHLYEHELADAHHLSRSLLHFTHGFHHYVEEELSHAHEAMRCCRIEHRFPSRTAGALLYGSILLAGFAVYFLVIFFSAAEH